jgi:hypothetical protein
MTGEKLEQLRSKFPVLTDQNQQYMIAFIEGLKCAQNSPERLPGGESTPVSKEKTKGEML